MRITFRIGMLLGLLLSFHEGSPLAAQEAAETFRQTCMSCHTIGGGRLVGPDLKDVEQRQDRDWLARFILDPKGVLDSGDPYALKLKDEAGGALMPGVPGMTRKQAEALLDLIAAESVLEASQFAGLDLGDEPFTELDIRRGEEIFLGHRALANGAPACIGCHTVGDLPRLGGGTLGPDLSRVYERLQGRKNLASWLLAPATEIMRPVFAGRALTQEEIVPLVAFFEDSARRRREDPGTSRFLFLLLGLAGAAGGFVLADGLWRRRFRGVRRELVRGRR